MLVRHFPLFQSHGVIAVIILGPPSFLFLAFLLASVYLRQAFPDLIGIAPPLQVKKAAYGEIIHAILDDRLKADSFTINLPPHHPEIAPGGRVLFERQSNGRIWVLFPIWYGRGSDLQGYLYSNAPFRPQDFTPNGGHGPAQHLDVCGLNHLAATPVETHWCWVIRRMD